MHFDGVLKFSLRFAGTLAHGKKQGNEDSIDLTASFGMPARPHVVLQNRLARVSRMQMLQD